MQSLISSIFKKFVFLGFPRHRGEGSLHSSHLAPVPFLVNILLSFQISKKTSGGRGMGLMHTSTIFEKCLKSRPREAVSCQGLLMRGKDGTFTKWFLQTESHLAKITKSDRVIYQGRRETGPLWACCLLVMQFCRILVYTVESGHSYDQPSSPLDIFLKGSLPLPICTRDVVSTSG